MRTNGLLSSNSPIGSLYPNHACPGSCSSLQNLIFHLDTGSRRRLEGVKLLQPLHIAASYRLCVYDERTPMGFFLGWE